MISIKTFVVVVNMKMLKIFLSGQKYTKKSINNPPAPLYKLETVHCPGSTLINNPFFIHIFRFNTEIRRNPV